LMKLYEQEETSLQLRGEIVLALGDMKDAAATPFLISLLDDEDEDMTLRRYACDALGKSGDRDALPSIKRAIDSKDNILRSYAIAAVGHFPGEETVQILMTSLRDSFPRVRELAAEKLGDLEASEAVDILIYRARRDPEKKVRQSAFRGLSKIGGGSAVKFLQEFLEGERNSPDYRTLAAEELIERRPESSAPPALKVMEQEWTKDNSFLLDAVCKLLSQKEFSGFDGLYERMLQHKSFVIQIYGIRGIQKNRVSRLRADVEKFTNEKFHPQLRRTALAALEVL
jgi:HEAT repeat protein